MLIFDNSSFYDSYILSLILSISLRQIFQINLYWSEYLKAKRESPIPIHTIRWIIEVNRVTLYRPGTLPLRNKGRMMRLQIMILSLICGGVSTLRGHRGIILPHGVKLIPPDSPREWGILQVKRRSTPPFTPFMSYRISDMMCQLVRT